MKKILPWVLPLLRTALFIVVGWLLVIITNQSYSDLIRWWTPLCTVYNLVTIGILYFVCRYEKISYKSLYNPKNEKLNVKKTFLFTLIMLSVGVGGMVGFSLLFYRGLPEFLVLPIPIWISVVNLLLLPITIVFAELPLYFGYSLDRLNKQTGKPIIAVIYVVFFYALQHSFIPLLWDYKYMAFRFLSFLPLMIFLGIQFNKKHQLKQMMVGHGVMDLSTSMQVLIMSIL